ncbi:MAG: peptidoglycan-binding domain-containing protein [Actinomycetia bacterium]|nr:peptidoglycan-binding domain-containing protein [Actinomycetes bacterium]
MTQPFTNLTRMMSRHFAPTRRSLPNLDALLKVRRSLILLPVVLALALAVGVSACGGTEEPAAQPSPAPPPGVDEPSEVTPVEPADPPPSPTSPPSSPSEPPPPSPPSPSPPPVLPDPPPPPAAEELPLIKVKGIALKTGINNNRVRQLQNALIYVGLMEEGSADGKFGPITKRAVQSFQLNEGLKGDGIAGEKTVRALNQAVKKSKRYDEFVEGDLTEPGGSGDS